MSKQNLHPKILQLRNAVGNNAIYRSKPIEQPESTRSMNSSTDDGRLLKMYFCIFGVKDDYGCIPMKGCFKKSIEERGPKSNATYKITVLWQHKQDEPLCVPSILKEDDIGLYAEFSPDEGVETCDRCVIQVRSGTVNNGSYGFNYVWDKMRYDEKSDSILMYETELYEVSPVTIGSQTGTYAVRNAAGVYVDEFLADETEDLIKQIPRKLHLAIRSIIDRHISLAKTQPLEQRRRALGKNKPKQAINYKRVIKEFNL